MQFKAETSVGLFIIIAIVIFLYMTFQIGVFRFDHARYHDYTLYFNDVSGLTKKCAVQIAGVKVGWVESIDLVDGGQQVRAFVRILKEYRLYKNAYGTIRQEGVLGSKYIEITPGDPSLPITQPGESLMKPGHEPVSIDTILAEFQVIAHNLKDITHSIKDVVGGEGKGRLNDILADLQLFTHNIKNEFPQLACDMRQAINRLTTQFENTAQPVADIVTKINQGEGLIGKFITDEGIARDAQRAIQGIRDYIDTADRLAIIFDSHVESMYGLGNRMWFNDGKGYFNVRIHPTEDYFYIVGMMGSYSGRIDRQEVFKYWEKRDGQQFDPQEMILDDWAKLYFSPVTYTEKRNFDQYMLNLQFGKIYDDIAFRTGIFEGTFGVGIDYDIPIDIPNFRWVSTFEAFDFFGRNRINDHALHLKWLNKLFFSESLYLIFGADDFISHTNRNGFFGAGFRFADDEVKYIFSRNAIPSPS